MKADIQETANSIAFRLRRSEDKLDKDPVEKLEDLRKNGESKNGAPENSKESGSKQEKLPQRPSQEKGTEKIGNMSNLVEVGDPVSLNHEPKYGGYMWFIKSIQPDEEGNDVVTIEYRGDHSDLKEERNVSWEDVTPRYESADMYVKKLRQYQKALDSAIESDDDFSRYYLGHVHEQISHFAQIFYNNNR